MINKNIKHLRKLHNLTQGEFADSIDIKRPAVGSYEEGRAEPKINTLLKISEKFNIRLDHLINKDLSLDSTEQLQKSVDGSNLRILSITTDKEDNENIQLVPQKASAGYTNGMSDPEFIEELPTLYLPMLQNQGTHRGFEIKGDSMLPVESGSIIIGKYVDNWNEIKNNHTYVIITEQEGSVYKRVQNNIFEDGTLMLISDNKEYSRYSIPVDEIKEIWEAKMFISSHIPNPTNSDTINSLTRLVTQLQQEIEVIKKKV